jgi:hypothetical protein
MALRDADRDRCASLFLLGAIWILRGVGVREPREPAGPTVGLTREID